MSDRQRKRVVKKAIGKAIKSANRIKYKCLLPGCSKDAIKSHSQQKKGQLFAIADEGKVYCMDKNIYQFAKDVSGEILKKKPIGEASRFVGYCQEHDTEIFNPIESGRLDQQNSQHAFLLMLRSISYEYASKRLSYDYHGKLLEEADRFADPDLTQMIKDLRLGIRLYLEKDAPYYLNALFDMYDREDFSGICTRGIKVTRNVGVSSSTSFSLLFEGHEEWKKINMEKVQPVVTLNLVPAQGHTDIVLSWLKEHDGFAKSIQTLDLKGGGVEGAINRLTLFESEDVCVNPSLWETLETTERHSIYRAMSKSESTSAAVPVPRLIRLYGS